MTETTSQRNPDPPIFLYGPSGSGKSAAGRLLAAGLNRTFIELDERIETLAGLSIPEIFAAETEAGFRRRERDVLQGALTEDPGVVALGGGALLDDENRIRVESEGRVICLTAPLEILVNRLAGDSENARPLLDGDLKTRMAALLTERAAHYASFPDQLDTDGKSLDEVVAEIQVRTGQFHVRGMGPGYDVRVGAGLLNHVAALYSGLELSGPYAVVTDNNVGAFYGDILLQALESKGEKVALITIPAGEVHKNLVTTGSVWDSFLDNGLERGSTVLALGGGVVGDLAGFAASAYLRGVAWVNMPTSLLAMVDASLGGKTGVDLPQGKNLIGAFHPPRLVVVDPVTLNTLPKPELRSGMAEVVKHGVIGDPALFELCEAGWSALQSDWAGVIRRAMALKIRVIQDDPFEGGFREALNLGHTVGHAVELASDFRLRHGEAIAIGMVAEARLAEQIGLAQVGLAARIGRVLQGLDLPTEIPPELDRPRILQAIQFDKKKARGAVRFALPEKIGQVTPGITVDDLSRIL